VRADGAVRDTHVEKLGTTCFAVRLKCILRAPDVAARFNKEKNGGIDSTLVWLYGAIFGDKSMYNSL
jgi:hypothetical protein